EVKKYTAMDMPFTCVAFTHDGKHLIVAGLDQKLHVWDLSSDKERIVEVTGGPVTALAVSPDAALAATADAAGGIRLWDLASGKERETVKQPDKLHGLGVADGGRTVVLWTITGQVRHLDALTGLERFTVKMPTEEGLSAEVAPDGHAALLWGRDDESLELWDGVRGKSTHKLTAHGGAVTCAA